MNNIYKKEGAISISGGGGGGGGGNFLAVMILQQPRINSIQSSTAWRHQAITWTNVDLSSLRSCCINLRNVSQQMS